MEHEFWIERWSNDQIGFHQPDGHPALGAYWPALELPATTRLLVPLCGKTPDMVWLARRGHAVTGIELSQRAARDFFAEQGIACETDTFGAFERYRSGDDTLNIQILVGDFFDAVPDTLGRFDGFYDRAALIALPDTMRPSYIARLRRLLVANARGLLITLEYDQNAMNGPPFSVPEREVARHLTPSGTLELCADEDGVAPDSMLARRRIEAAREKVYAVRLNAPRGSRTR